MASVGRTDEKMNNKLHRDLQFGNGIDFSYVPFKKIALCDCMKIVLTLLYVYTDITIDHMNSCVYIFYMNEKRNIGEMERRIHGDISCR